MKTGTCRTAGLLCDVFFSGYGATFRSPKSELGIKPNAIRIQLALFDGDALLERTEIVVGASERVDDFRHFRASHKLGAEAAEIVLDNFAEQVALKNAKLHMPIHESDDWESIQRETYTLAFWCYLDA